MESENWTPPSENQNQPDTSPRHERKSFFQQECLQQTWMDIKVLTWIKCLIVIAVLFVAAAFIAPKFTTARPQQEDTTDYCEFDGYESEEGSWYDSNECFQD